MTPLIGITACTKQIQTLTQDAAPRSYSAAVVAVSGGVPVLLPPLGRAMEAVLDRIDGLLVDGSESNVEPARYGVAEDETPGQHDSDRDATTLPLIRAAIERGLPVLAICRGIQELNVALGGTLHQRVHAVPGRDDHREPGGTPDEKFSARHDVTVRGGLALLLGADRVAVNSLHGQAIDRLAPGLTAEATASDGTIEAVAMPSARGFLVGVQWHPEWLATTDAPSRAIFEAFGDACRAYAGRTTRD